MIAVAIWVFVVGGNVIQVLSQPNPMFSGGPQLPWFIVFMPIIVVIGAYFTRDLPGEFSIGKIVDQKFGLGTYREFMRVLKLELLFSAMCFGIVLSDVARTYLIKVPSEPLAIIGFFFSGGIAFLLAYFIRRARDNSAKTPVNRAPAAVQSPQNATAFWNEARRRRNICWIVFPSWLLAGPILVGLYSLILPQVPIEARGIAALLTWGAVIIWAQQRFVQLRCYKCGERAFSNSMFFWNYAKCRNCGASPKNP